jgi:polysaccharide pyruvyl transferase WcaK-like protein
MASIGLDTRHDPICPDLAFGLTHARSTREPSSHAVTVGLGVMTYYGWSADRHKNAEIYTRYIAKITEFAGWLLAQGHGVHLLVGEDTDGQALSAIHAALVANHPAGDGRIRAEQARSLAELARQIDDTDLVVATRFHNVVCALMCEKPTISLGYAAKNDALMAEMGLAEFCQHIESFDVETLKRQFTTLQARRTEAARAIRIKTDELQRRLEEQGRRIAAIAVSRWQSRRERAGEPA